MRPSWIPRYPTGNAGRRPWRLLILASLIAVAADGPHNPLFPGADPDLVATCDGWMIYPTTQGQPPGVPHTASFYAWQSPDLVHWRRGGTILDMAAIRWIGDDGAPAHHLWAPTLAAGNGRFYFYYSVGPQNPTPSRIGVAVGTSPEGPFIDTGKPLVTGGNGFEAIDPMVFTDPHSGRSYLYAGGSAGARLRVFELKSNMVEIAREVPVANPPAFTEGAFVHERNGIYYLSYSHGRYNGPDYSVHYATATSPEGPWTYRGAILVSDATHQGPGHHAFARNPATGEWFIAYHRWERSDATPPFRGDRQVAIDRVSYDANGLILPIVMTDGPPPASVLGCSACPTQVH
nr:family 43 glycosylhydrolase [Sphingomonas sp.]